MADVQEARPGLGRPALIAIAFAVVALVTSLIAVIVVMKRSGSTPAPAPTQAVAAPSPIERTVAASDVLKLKRDVVTKATDGGGTTRGVRVRDDDLRKALGLEPDDIITAINGREIRREFDVYDAVLGMSMMDTSTVYVELQRAEQPVLVRWKLDGGLRTARRDPVRRPSTIGGITGGGTGLGGSIDPFGSTSPTTIDPLVATIRKIDDFHYEVPRSTVDSLSADPSALARQCRIVPAIRNGKPDGFKLYAIRQRSLWAAVGLQNGDTLRTINGLDLTSPDKALEAYTKVKDADVLEIELLRRGVEETLTIRIK